MKFLQAVLLAAASLAIVSSSNAQDPWVTYEAKAGPGQGRHVVLLAGDEEYRSEEALPMLGKILSQRHGFKCTVLFSVGTNGTIDPINQRSLSNSSALESADAVIMALRFRKWPDADMKRFVDYFLAGKPVIALRTSTHAFDFPKDSTYSKYTWTSGAPWKGGFGKEVLGETWVTHWGRHKAEATRGVIEPAAKDDPLLRGVEDVFGDTDVYEAYPPADAKILLRGQVLKGMKPEDAPADYRKKRASDKQEQGVNAPPMPVAWTRLYKNEAGRENKILCTTMGSATDLQSEGLRRLVVNGVYWSLGLDVPAKTDVRIVGEFKPTMYGFNGFKKGVKPADHALDAKPRADAAPAPPAKLALNPGDHIALVGNALPDRMQHSGYFETLIHQKFPQHNLVFRNLAAAGDEVATWHRSENFGSRDQWLERVKADVIFAFYGFNESFKGYDGLAAFRADLDRFLKDTVAKNYSGKGAPRVVLFGPAADEKHADANFQNPAANNERLRDYSEAMAGVAAANGVPFVELFKPSQQVFADAAKKKQSLTVEGHYLTPEGDRLLAPAMFQSLLGEAAPALNEKLRAAVNDKNWQWHQRYRTVDGYNVYGGRSGLAYQPGKGAFQQGKRNPEAPFISNYQVMQEEMTQRDVLTANRDARVWAVARGGDLVVKDDNLPSVTPVKSNKPWSPDQEVAPFLSGEESIAKMKLHSGMKVNLFADEKQFPDLVNPVQMAWDTKGRLWVSAWLNYPERTPTSKVGDKLLIFEDTDGDGRADKRSVFIEDLNCPTGFQFYKDGVLLMQAPDLWFVRDTDGDGKADWKERVLMGMDSADSHHTANSICHEPGGAIYLSDGVFHRTQVETAAGPLRNHDGAVWRFEPRTGKMDLYVSYGFANPHGRVFDRWGNDIITDATGNNSYFAPAFSGRLDSGKHSTLKDFWQRPSRPCPGTGILSSRHFPDEFQGNFLNINVISFQGIYRVKVSEDGSGLKGETMEHLISADPKDLANFRPICVSIGPDGAIYFCDWANNIIGHMQHHIRDPNRDKAHGRIYRITYEGRPLLKQKPIDGQPIPALLELLKEPEDGVRELARIELGKRDSKAVIAATKKWAASLDKKHKDYEHHMLEALWVHQWHNVVDLDLLKNRLASPDGRARAQAGRVLCYWRDRVPDSLALLKKLAEDEHPRARLEAVRAASFFNEGAAADVALAALKHPTDYYIDYTLKETLRQLDKPIRRAIADGVPIAADNPAGLNRILGGLGTAELLKLPRTQGVLVAMLTRPDVLDAQRIEFLDSLAKERRTTRVAELLTTVESISRTDPAAAASLARFLPLNLSSDLKAERPRVAKLVASAKTPEIRQPAWAALAVADDGFDKVWSDAAKSPTALADLLGGIPYLNDPDFRARACDRVQPLLTGVPASLSGGAKEAAPKGRYVRVELPRKGTLTLAEVQVFSGGNNVAPGGKAKQSSVASAGPASRAIDGKTDGAYEAGTSTHTREGESSPWWELDLGGEKTIERVTVWNRTDGELGKRLDGFTLTVLDARRAEVFKKAGNPAPAQSVTLTVGAGNPADSIRRAAIRAAVAMPVKQEITFGALAGLILRGEAVTDAASGIRTLPRSAWTKEASASAASALLAWARKLPAGERTAQENIEAMNLAGDLAGALPAAQATALRKELRGLSVPVFVIKAVREQMRYDTPRLVVEAGKPFEIILVNDDFMQHNLMIVKPGTREKVGRMADVMQPDQFDDRGRAFYPKTSDIIYGTRLLDAGQQLTLTVGGIHDEGEYDYVCTYPNHWAAMWGQLIVTRDVDDYLQKHPAPAAPAAAHAGHNH
jgi:glucose/arabinose dehydrogenase/azurin